MEQIISIGDSYLLIIRIAQELNLLPNGIIYADLYEQGKLHPSSFLHFENFAKNAKQKIIKAGLVEQAKQTKAYTKKFNKSK